MIYFTKYAEKKFSVLNDHKVFIRREEVETALATPDKRGRIGACLTAEKGGVKVIYQKEGDVKRVITFYPC